MNSLENIKCAEKAAERAREMYAATPETALREMRRYADTRDTAEFATDPRIVIACRAGACAVTLLGNENGLSIEANGCQFSSAK